MRVEQNDFRDLLAGNLSLPTQAQHVLCVLAATWVTHSGLTGKEGLKAFALQAVQQRDGGYICVSFTRDSCLSSLNTLGTTRNSSSRVKGRSRRIRFAAPKLEARRVISRLLITGKQIKESPVAQATGLGKQLAGLNTQKKKFQTARATDTTVSRTA